MKNPLMKRSIMIAIAFLILFGFMATVYTNYLSNNIYSETNMYLKEIAVQTAGAINNKMSEHLTQLETLALMIESGHTKEPILFEYLNDLANQGQIKRFGVTDLEGNVQTSDHKTFNIKDRDYFQESIKGKKTTSETMVDYVDGQFINVYSVPLYNQQKQITGVLFATYYTEKVSEVLDNASFNNNGYSFIFNEEGKIILPSQNANVLDDIQNIHQLSSQNDIHLKDIVPNGQGIITFTDLHGTKNYLTYANIDNNDWIVASVFPQEVVTNKIQKVIQTAFIAWILVGSGSAILISYIYFIQKKNKLQLTQLAFEDPITHHYNFNKFIELCHKNNHLTDYVLVNCDIKGFKWFNEIYGEDIANDLLMTMMKCIDKICHEDELCCREKDDHFAFLFRKDHVSKLKERLLQLANFMRDEFNSRHSTAQFYFHFGVYQIDQQEFDINKTFKKTQFIKNEFKQLSQDDIMIYQEDAFQKDLHVQQIEKDFSHALSQQEFKIFIQPKVNLETEEVISGEALVRWIHPQDGMISPASFIPIFEKNGMLEALDAYVFQQVLQTLENWNLQYHHKFYLSVNVSRTYLFNDHFIDNFIELVQLYNIDPEQIEVEITETTAINHKHELINILNKLKKHHIRVALDDFGSGYSSLNMLKDFPIDVVKIDQEFFRTNNQTHERSHIIIEQVIELCHKLNIIVVAEGVETKEQRDFLYQHHCDYIQGYYYYKPMPVHDYEDLFFKDNKKIAIK